MWCDRCQESRGQPQTGEASAAGEGEVGEGKAVPLWTRVGQDEGRRAQLGAVGSAFVYGVFVEERRVAAGHWIQAIGTKNENGNRNTNSVTR